MKVSLIGRTKGLLNIPAQAAALCYDSTNAEKSLAGALSSGHESVIEHQVYSFQVEGVSRVLLAQLTRHRMASFSVQSQRYCGVDKQDVIIPPTISENEQLAKEYVEIVKMNRKFYQHMVDLEGIPEEDARYITPQGITTKLIMTANAREWKHILALRMCNRAQWEIRMLMDEIYKILVKEDPVIFADAGPGCVRGACPEGRRCCGKSRKEELKSMIDNAKKGSA